MVELVISALMWALVIVLLVFRRARKERSVLYAAVTIAITMMLNDDDLYVLLDGRVGHRDLIHLVSAISLMIGVHFLAQGISRAGVQRWMSGWTARIALWAAIVVTTVAFFLVPHRGETTTSFMREYGEHPAATVYGTTQYVYFLFVFSALSATAVHAMRTRPLRREKVAGALLLTGSLSTVALSVVVLCMNLSHLIGGLDDAQGWRPAYYVLQITTFLFLTLGLGVAPIARWVAENRRSRAIAEYLQRLTPLWEHAVALRPALNARKGADTAEVILHRRIVEVRDAAMDRRVDFTLTPADRALLAEAEGQLVAGTR